MLAVLRLIERPATAFFSKEICDQLATKASSKPAPGEKKSSRRIILQCDVVASLVDWLARTGWEKDLRRQPDLCEHTSAILWQLAGRKFIGDSPEELVAASLVARYLIFVATHGVVPTDVSTISAVTLGADPVRLPKYWAPPPSSKVIGWRSGVGVADCRRFLASITRFWSPSKWRRGPKIQKRRGQRATQTKLLESCGLKPPSAQEIRRSQVLVEDSVEENERFYLPKNKALAHAYLASYARQILPSHKAPQQGIKVLLTEASMGPYSRYNLRLIGSLCLGQLALLHGIPIVDGFELTIDSIERSDLGWIEPSKGYFHLQVANGFYPKIHGRIPSQTVRLPLAKTVKNIASYLFERGVRKLKELYSAKRLDEAYTDIRDFMGEDDSSRPSIVRLHEGWLYVSIRMANVNPAVLALLRGEIFGPFRADSNYLDVGEQLLFDAMACIHGHLFRLARRECTKKYVSDSPEKRYGKGAPSLFEWQCSAASVLRSTLNGNELVAALNLINASHGRRWTSDVPHPAAHMLDVDGQGILIFADKDHGGGRRIRLVPVSNSGSKTIRILHGLLR